jgi:hypothetical protein
MMKMMPFSSSARFQGIAANDRNDTNDANDTFLANLYFWRTAQLAYTPLPLIQNTNKESSVICVIGVIGGFKLLFCEGLGDDTF